jgi:hypothetical protein
MRSAFAALAFLAVAASRGGCGDGATSGYDPCAGKACSEPCHACAPGDAACTETAELKLCDPGGRCVPASTSFTCEIADACAGKACGQTCAIALPCHFANPPCLAPVAAGQCDYGGSCVPDGAASCAAVDSCMGQACGVACSMSMMMDCSMMMGAACACDGMGDCISAALLACAPPPADPCAGKACGDACDPCGGMCGHPYTMACDRGGQCVIGAPGTCMP